MASAVSNSRKYNRQEVKQVTKQWVRENCKNITDRDMGLLRLIYNNKRRLLRRDQIEILYPEFASTDRLNKRIKLLYNLHVIDKIYPQVGLGEGSSKQHICLDKAGLILLDVEKYNKPITTDPSGSKSLPLGWEHKVLINDYECWITQAIKELGGSIVDYRVEEPLPYGDTKVIPDIFCMLKSKGKGYLFFIEVDLGTEDLPYVKGKIDNYGSYYLSKQWTKQDWAKMFKTPAFPRILFLTENGKPKRMQALQEYTTEGALRFHYGHHRDFKDLLTSIIDH
jgi:hypothetical protein